MLSENGLYDVLGPLLCLAGLGATAWYIVEDAKTWQQGLTFGLIGVIASFCLWALGKYGQAWFDDRWVQH